MPAGGASSFHLIWRLPGSARAARLVEVAAVLEVITPPSVPALYFWALQVDFVDEGGVWGGGHTGLQWNRRYPGGAAVNWGGYASRELGGKVLEGSVSDLTGFADDPNTVTYPWQPGRRYRLRVYRSPDVPGAWRADVTDTRSEEVTVIRDLFPARSRGQSFLRRLFAGGGSTSDSQAGGGYLTCPIVWSEVFADCDAPSVSVRWSDLQAVDEAGTVFRPDAVSVNYQSASEGGCPNTSVTADDAGILQITNTQRIVEQGAILTVPRLGR